MYCVRHGFHAAGKLLPVHNQPVADLALVTVVDLEDVRRVARRLVHGLQVAENDLFVDLLIIVVPRGVSGEAFYLPARSFHGICREIAVEHLVVASLGVQNVEKSVFSRKLRALDVLDDGEHVFLHVRVKHGKSGALVKRTEQLRPVAAADVGVTVGVEQLPAVIDEIVIAERGGESARHGQTGGTEKPALPVFGTVLQRARPGLVTAAEKAFLGRILPRLYHSCRTQPDRTVRTQHHCESAVRDLLLHGHDGVAVLGDDFRAVFFVNYSKGKIFEFHNIPLR